MAVEYVGLIGIGVMFLLMFLRVPIAISMSVPAIGGILYLKSFRTLSSVIESVVWNQSFSYSFSTIPMFVLMGELLYISGISSELFSAFRLWLSRVRGGLGMATVGSSAIFAAASGSSLANTATMGVIASKEMLKAGYSRPLTSGSIVAGGTLGVLIPPSTLFIIYGMLTEQSIGQLLMAGLLPGIMLMSIYLLTIFIIVRVMPSSAPAPEGAVPWRERLVAMKSTVWIVLIFLLVIGGMYSGWFSPTEAAGVGAFFTFVLALIRRRLTLKNFIQALSSTLRTTGFLFAIIIMAFILNYFLALTRVPNIIAHFLDGIDVSNFVLFMIIVVMYLLLGMVMDGLAMVVVTLPIVMPLLELMGADLIWFGVIIVLIMEMGMLTPPVGMNCFVLAGAVDELKLGDIFKGAAMFVPAIILVIFILYFFPDIALYLPRSMF